MTRVSDMQCTNSKWAPEPRSNNSKPNDVPAPTVHDAEGSRMRVAAPRAPRNRNPFAHSISQTTSLVSAAAPMFSALWFSPEHKLQISGAGNKLRTSPSPRAAFCR